MLILTVIPVLIDSVVRPQNNSALECPCCLDYSRLCCNSPFNLLCFKIWVSHSTMKCGKCLMRCEILIVILLLSWKTFYVKPFITDYRPHSVWPGWTNVKKNNQTGDGMKQVVGIKMQIWWIRTSTASSCCGSDLCSVTLAELQNVRRWPWEM